MHAKLATILAVVLCLGVVAGCPVTVPPNAEADAAVDQDGDGTDAPAGGQGDVQPNNRPIPTDNADGGSADAPPDQDQQGGGQADEDSSAVQPGTYVGVLNCVVSDTAFGIAGQPSDEAIAVSLVIDQQGRPVAFTVPGYSALVPRYEFIAGLARVGEAVTLEHASGGYAARLTITVAELTLDAAGGRVVLNLVHEGQEDQRREEGTGTQVIEYEFVADRIEYSARTHYDVTWIFPEIEAEVTLTFECEGALARE